MTESFAFDPAEVECNAETDVLVEVRAFVVACARALDDRPGVRHPGDVGQGGGILRPGDCLRSFLLTKESPCVDPSAEWMLLARVDAASQCPPATERQVKLATFRHPIGCLERPGPASAAHVVPSESICPGCASKRRPVAVAVALFVTVAVATALVTVLAEHASATVRRQQHGLTPDAIARIPLTTWWQLWGWGLRLAGSIALVVSGLSLITFLQLANIASGDLTGGRDVGPARVVFGLGAVWLTAAATTLWRTGRRLGAPTAHQLMRRDPRPPIVYLRSFRDDAITSRQVVPLYPLICRGIRSQAPFSDVEALPCKA
ncbi:MAG: hypothetical protein LC777_05375 [Actinobacteria bacterium]|nr:hypothetical protein [Actinomycetota bacterium]